MSTDAGRATGPWWRLLLGAPLLLRLRNRTPDIRVETASEGVANAGFVGWVSFGFCAAASAVQVFDLRRRAVFVLAATFATRSGVLDRWSGNPDYLISRGIATNRVATRGFGETQPIASNANEAGRSRNRRCEIIVVP